jgi:hypothetical protein
VRVHWMGTALDRFRFTTLMPLTKPMKEEGNAACGNGIMVLWYYGIMVLWYRNGSDMSI